jgi:GNAT superfamily N-acetyltransferase
MDTFYISNNTSKYNFLNIKPSNQSINEIQKIILYTPNFCRNQQSISTNELKSYIVSGITFFKRNAINQITGLINFDININIINILGICVPGQSQGIGSYLINLVKQFAKVNNIIKIKLKCYDNLKLFYEKLGFKISNESTFYDSDDSDEQNKIRYEMFYNINNISGGRRKRRKSLKKKYKKIIIKSLKQKKTR